MKPQIENAPGLIWLELDEEWKATWRARDDLIKRGFRPKNVVLWKGAELTEIEIAYIQDTCNRLQGEMLAFSRSMPVLRPYDGTIKALIECYQTDPDSTFHRKRYAVRQNHDWLLKRIIAKYGEEQLSDLRGRIFLGWHKEWSDSGRKVAAGHSFISQLRTLFTFGWTILDDPECKRLKDTLRELRFPMSKARTERLTAEQAIAVRAKAHWRGWASIALAQAMQFDLMLRQKDVIGEWVPIKEPGVSAVVREDYKWIVGADYSEIDENLILRHVTSKRDKPIVLNLKLAPMVLEELGYSADAPITRADLPASGPIIICETTGYPYWRAEFRRKWRVCADLAGIPKEVKNMDSRSGAISEATDAGVDLEKVRHAATHSNISMTQRYSRGSEEKTAEVMQLRAAHRNKPKT